MSLAVLYPWMWVGSSDVINPVLNITVSPTRTKISQVSGFDATVLSFTVDEDYRGYQIRIVPSNASTVNDGTLLESGSGGLADVAREVTITDDELIAASAGDGSKIVKVFAQDMAFNWST